jgi:hypothetical protein
MARRLGRVLDVVRRNVTVPIGRSERELTRGVERREPGPRGAVDRLIERHPPPFGRDASELGICTRGQERRGLILAEFTEGRRRQEIFLPPRFPPREELPYGFSTPSTTVRSTRTTP